MTTALATPSTFTKDELELAKLHAEVKVLNLDIEKRQTEFDRDAATATTARVWQFVGDVYETSVGMCVRQLGTWARESNEPIEIHFTSRGGSVFDGLALYDFIQLIKEQGIHVTTVGLGWVASMGGVLLQAGNHRVLTKRSWLMIHEASTGTWGKVSDIKDEMELIGRLDDVCTNIMAERSKLSVDQIKDKCMRKDWWLNAAEAKRFGFIDEVRG